MYRYEFCCQYCGVVWRLDHVPDYPKCSKCKDTNIKIKDLAKSKIDYYQGAPEFEEKTKEITLEDPKVPDDSDKWFFRGGGILFDHNGEFKMDINVIERTIKKRLRG